MFHQLQQLYEIKMRSFVYNRKPISRMWRIFATFMSKNPKLCSCLSCSCSSSPDYILVRDGIDLRSPTLNRFCGNRSSIDVESNTENLVVEFVTDAARRSQSQGFTATFSFVLADRTSSAERSLPPATVSATAFHSEFSGYDGKCLFCFWSVLPGR